MIKQWTCTGILPMCDDEEDELGLETCIVVDRVESQVYAGVRNLLAMLHWSTWGRLDKETVISIDLNYLSALHSVLGSFHRHQG